MENVLVNMRNLRSDIAAGIINLDKIHRGEYTEWGGAGVIVTTDESRAHLDRDIFLCTPLAPVIFWLMLRLRDIGYSAWDWQNKYTYFGLMAEAAQNFIAEHGESDNQKPALALHIIDQVIHSVADWKEEQRSRVRKDDDC